MLKLHTAGDGSAAHYEADGPLTYRDVARLRRRHYLMAGKCCMRWQGDGDGLEQAQAVFVSQPRVWTGPAYPL